LAGDRGLVVLVERVVRRVRNAPNWCCRSDFRVGRV